MNEITLSQDGAVLSIGMNRPDRKNALTAAMNTLTEYDWPNKD